jgi:hypothetical protein
VVADQRDRAAVADQGGALVRLGSVADHVAEAPDLLDLRGVDLVEHRLEGRQIAVNVAE